MNDLELLEQFRQGSADAFSAIVRRHVDWVYSAAKRRVRDAHLAEDVTQAVFITLAQKTPYLRRGSLSPWLFGVLIRVSKTALKRQAIRQRHESEAAKMRPTTTPDPQADWNTIAPNLEEAVARLRFADQQAILLRFYEQLSFAEVAAMLGITEEAARKRVSRATEKLRANLGSDGTGLSALSIATMLISHATIAAPSNLVASALSASLLSANTTVSTLVNSAKAIMFWEKIKVSSVVALASAMIAAGGATVISQVAAPPPAASTAPTPPQRVEPVATGQNTTDADHNHWAAMLKAVREEAALIHSIEVDYQLNDEFGTPKRDSETELVIAGTQNRYHLATVGGKFYQRSQFVQLDEAGQPMRSGAFTQEAAFDGLKGFNRNSNSPDRVAIGSSAASIRQIGPKPSDLLWPLPPEDLDARLKSGAVRLLSIRDELLAGEDTVRVQVQGVSGSMIFWVAKNKGWLPVKVHHFRADGSRYIETLAEISKVVGAGGNVCFYPTRIVTQMANGDRLVMEVQADSLKLNRSIAEERFTLAPGTSDTIVNSDLGRVAYRPSDPVDLSGPASIPPVLSIESRIASSTQATSATEPHLWEPAPKAVDVSASMPSGGLQSSSRTSAVISLAVLFGAAILIWVGIKVTRTKGGMRSGRT